MHFLEQFHLTSAVADKLRRRKPLVVFGSNFSQSVDQRTGGFVEVECIFRNVIAQAARRIRRKLFRSCRLENMSLCGGRMHFL